MSRLGQTVRVREVGGPSIYDWWWSVGCNYVDIDDLAENDIVFLWASAEPTIGGGSTGTGTIVEVASWGMYALTCTSAGSITVEGANIIAHKPTSLKITDCA